MTDKLLFGIIAFLLVVIAGIGMFAAASYPDQVATIPSAAVGAVERAVGVSDDAEKSPSTESITTPVQNTGVDDGDDDDVEEARDDNATTRPSPAKSAPPPPPQTKPSAGTSKPAGTFTMQDVAAHANAASCYTAISGSVYDLTSFIGQHRGGSAAILSLCGRDGTAAFMQKHGSQSRPQNELASLKIGVLAR